MSTPRSRSPFPVFPGEPSVTGPVRRSRNAPRRAAVLIAVHVAILLHIVHWLATGSTVSPVEPSESMQTLELGRVNAGFVFFALAILSTAVFGRFFCGWGCHVVALQDGCAWLMRRCGIRPRPFRSRVLAYGPLLIALYMFVWPTFRRAVLTPLAGVFAPELAARTAPAPFPGFSAALVTESFWETFPSLWIAVPFLAVCGFAVVYLLGAKGFCTYGCPYGAVFGAADRVAAGRIRVTDACNQCGHCTVTCTSNVRVHQEVRDHGMVVDPGCMKCQDCVSVCPNDALYFGFGARAPRKARSPRHWDVGPGADVALGAAALLSFLVFRGAYDTVPLLMAVGMALCTTFLAWKGWAVLRGRDSSLQQVPLRAAGRLRPAGAMLLAGAALASGLVLHTAAVRGARARAEAWDSAVRIPAETALRPDRPDVPAEILRAARGAEAWYRRADSLPHGGWGLLGTPEVPVRRAWMAAVLGDWDGAAAQLHRVAARNPEPRLRRDLARVEFLAGRPGVAVGRLRDLVAADPGDADAHGLLAEIHEAEGDLAAAAASRVIHVNLTGDPVSRARLADLYDRLDRPADAARAREAALVNRPGGP